MARVVYVEVVVIVVVAVVTKLIKLNKSERILSQRKQFQALYADEKTTLEWKAALLLMRSIFRK